MSERRRLVYNLLYTGGTQGLKRGRREVTFLPRIDFGINDMASGLLMLLDDIATILDDIAILTKVAAKKTAGVLGDDLALNAQQVTGVDARRELPVIWAVAKGSLINKAILVPI